MRNIRKMLRAAAVIVVIVSAFTMSLHYYNRGKTDKMYEEVAQNVFTEAVSETASETGFQEEVENTESQYSSPVDFEKLEEINPDVIGWIQIPGTQVNYPIVYCEEDNEKYLHTDFEGNESVSGAIYLDCDDEPDFSCLHNIIYGHHMKNGTMFADIMNFRDETFFNEHQEIILYLPEREIKLIPMACLYTEGTGIRRKTDFSDNSEFQDYIKSMTANASVYKEPEYSVKNIYSLVTCSYEFDDARTILYCYEADEEVG